MPLQQPNKSIIHVFFIKDELGSENLSILTGKRVIER